MSRKVEISQVAVSTPFDNDTNGFTAEDVQAAIEEVDAKVTGKPRALLLAGYNGNAGTGRDLEYFHSSPSTTSPWVAAEDGKVKALSLSTKTSTTATVTLYLNTVSVDTITITTDTKETKSGLNHSFLEGDELSCEVTSGSIQDPIFSTSIEIDL